MRILLDTHVFLWFILNDAKLPPKFASDIRDLANDTFLSVTSIWEVSIKYRLGKLQLPGPPSSYLLAMRDAHGIASMNIDQGAIAPLESLPHLHRDPFDRILIAQTIQHSMTLATVDPDIMAYSVPVLPTS